MSTATHQPTSEHACESGVECVGALTGVYDGPSAAARRQLAVSLGMHAKQEILADGQHRVVQLARSDSGHLTSSKYLSASD